jgi:hypothetical protein
LAVSIHRGLFRKAKCSINVKENILLKLKVGVSIYKLAVVIALYYKFVYVLYFENGLCVAQEVNFKKPRGFAYVPRHVVFKFRYNIAVLYSGYRNVNESRSCFKA